MQLAHWLTGLQSRFELAGFGRRRKRRNTPVPAQISGQTLESRLLLTTYINAGGPDLAGDPAFEAGDDFESGNSRPLRRRQGVDTSGVDASIPQSVFQTIEIGRGRNGDVHFEVPVNPGDEYQVDLLFSEIQALRARPGARVFDVSVEGNLFLDNFDIFSTAGFRTAVSQTTTFTAGDDTLDIDLTAIRDRAAIAGIVVTNLSDTDPGGGDGGGDGGGGDGGGDGGGGNENQAPEITSSIADQEIDQDTSTSPISFAVIDPDGDTINVTGMSSNSGLLPESGILINMDGPAYTVQLTPTAGVSGEAVVTLTASDGVLTDTEQFVLTVNPVEDPVDPPAMPTQYLNTGGGDVDQFMSADVYVSSGIHYSPRARAISNVPDGLPESVFQSNLTNRRRHGDVMLDIPTTAGQQYQVDLLFSELRLNRAGRRIFDVSLDGELVLDNFDVFANAGRHSALVQSFTITGDGNLDIDLSHVRNLPIISGVIVTPLGDEGNGPTQNTAPVLQPLSDQTVNVGDTVSFTAFGSDADGDSLTYSIETAGLPGSPSINPQLGAFSWMPPSAGTFDIEIGVSDGQATDTDVVRITVNADQSSNSAPVIDAISAKQVFVGSTLSFTATATDPDAGDVVSWSLGPNAPTGASINATTGLVTWTPTANQVGSMSLPIVASDGELTDAVSVGVTVETQPVNNSAPILNPIGNQAGFVGSTITFTASATDSDGDSLTFALSPTAPAGASIDPNTGVFTWIPAQSDIGTNAFSVIVSDGTAQDSEAIAVNVQGSNTAPTLAAVETQTVEEQTPLTVQLSATDPDSGDTLTYSLVSTDLPGTPTVNPTTGLFEWTPPFADGPGFSVTVAVEDSGGLTDQQTFMVVVTDSGGSNNNAPVLDPISVPAATVGANVTFTVTATDLDNDPLTFFLDPSAPSGAAINGSTGVFSWTPSSAGTFSFPVSVTDGTVSTSQTVTIVVTGGTGNQAPAFGPVANQSVTVNTQLQFTLPATDPENDQLTFSLAPDTLPGNPQIDASTGVFTWVPTQISPGFQVTAFVTDSGGLSDSVTFLVTVNDGPPGGNTPPSFNPIPDQTAVVGQQLTVTIVATDSDPGTTLEYFLDPTAPAGAIINGTTGVLTWTPEAGDVGEVDIDVFVTDGTATVAETLSVTVSNNGGGGGGGNNTAPSFGPQNNRSIAAESTLRTTFTAVDDNPGDIITYSLVTTGLPGNPTINASTGELTWTPPASAAGNSFQVTIRATDSGGLSDETVVTVNVLDVGTGNQPPSIDPIANQAATVDQQFSVQISATDPDGDSLVYFLDPTAPFGVNVNAQGILTWTPAAGDIGTVTFPVFVSDGTANRFIDLTIVVSAATGGGNTAPSLAPLENQVVDEGATLTVTPIVDDPDAGDTLTFELVTENLPGTASINPTTGVFTWVPSASAGGTQVYSVTIRVTDSANQSDVGSFNVTVNDTLA